MAMATNDAATDGYDHSHDDGHTEEFRSLLEPSVTPTLSSAAKKRLLIYAFPALLLCTFVISFDDTFMIGNYSRRIAVDLHDFKNASWLILGFVVTESAFMPLYGHAAQVYGHRNATLFAAAAVSVGLLLCSLSYSLWQLALARVVVGTGTAGIELLTVIIMNDLVQLYELPLWNSATVVAGTVGLMLGGPIGATSMDRMGFRPTFGIEFIVMFIGVLMLYVTLRLPETKDKNDHHAGSSPRIEYPSAALLLLSVATPLCAINLGGEMFPWDHPVVLTLLGITPLLVVMFYLVETRIAVTPIVPKRFLVNRNIAVALICTLPMKFVFDQLRFSFGTLVEARSFQTGGAFGDWALTCIYLGGPLGTIISGILIRKYRRFKPFLLINILADIVIYICFALGWIKPEKASFAPVLVLVGATEGFSEGIWLVALLSLVEPDDQPLLYAFYDLALCIAGDLGIAISLAMEGSLVRSDLHSKLSGYANGDEIIRKSLEDLKYVRTLAPKIQTIILDALVNSTEVAFGISCLVLCISLVSCFYVKDMSKSRSIVIG